MAQSINNRFVPRSRLLPVAQPISSSRPLAADVADPIASALPLHQDRSLGDHLVVGASISLAGLLVIGQLIQNQSIRNAFLAEPAKAGMASADPTETEINTLRLIAHSFLDAFPVIFKAISAGMSVCSYENARRTFNALQDLRQLGLHSEGDDVVRNMATFTMRVATFAFLVTGVSALLKIISNEEGNILGSSFSSHEVTQLCYLVGFSTLTFTNVAFSITMARRETNLPPVSAEERYID